MRILIAEDDQMLADGLLRSLRGSGYAVDRVATGTEADAALASHEFDLLILDLGLPKLHGFDVLRKLLYTRYHANWFSHFAKRPSMLFTGVQVRNTIHVGKLGGTQRQDQTSRIHRWPNEARSHLFATLSYAAFNPNLWKHRIPKLNTQGLIDAFEKNLVPGGRTIEATMNRHATAHAASPWLHWDGRCRRRGPVPNVGLDAPTFFSARRAYGGCLSQSA